METKTKIILGVILACLLAIMAYTIKSQRDIINALQQNSDQQRFLKDDITAIKASQLTDDNFNKKLAALNMDMDTLKTDLKATNSTITSILVSTNTTPGVVITNGTNTGFIPRPQPTTDTTGTIPAPTPPTPQGTTSDGQPCFADKYGYFAKIPYYNISEPTKNNQQIPFGQVQFDVQKPAPWNVTVYPREYTTSVAIATDTLGNKTAYSKMTIKSQDKIYSLPETQVQYYERLPSASFSFWNPRLFLTAGGAMNMTQTKGSANAGIVLGIMSYGQLKSNPDISVLQIGAAYQSGTNKASVIINPINFNIGKLLSKGLMNNTYIGPSIQVDTGGNIFAGGNISLGF